MAIFFSQSSFFLEVLGRREFTHPSTITIMKFRSLLFLSAMTLPVFFTGCSSVKTVEIVADGSIASASVQVDVVKDSSAVQTVSVSQYFLPGNLVRAGANPTTVRFGTGSTSYPVSVAGKGSKVVVLAHLPGYHEDATGDADKRRKTIPLSGKYNGVKVTPTMRVNVSQGGITVSPTK